MTEVNKSQIILGMCMTHRHDFALDAKEPGFPSSGMTDQQREALRRDMEQLYEHHFEGLIAAQAARIAELELDKVRLESEAMYGAAGFQAAKERIAELERECERLRERLEISSQCPYDGIATRDKTIAALQQELDRCRDDAKDVWGLAESRADTVVQLRAELEACRKDAERWRYFRDRLGEPGDEVHVMFGEWCWADASIEDVETAIDAAMQEANDDASS